MSARRSNQARQERRRKDWSTPVGPDVLAADGPSVGRIMPETNDIPRTFRNLSSVSEDWYRFAQQTFFYGLAPESGFIEFGLPPDKDDEWGDAALAQIFAALEAPIPQHQHKMAAVAWLASMFFDTVVYGGLACTQCGEQITVPEYDCSNCGAERTLSYLGKLPEEQKESSKDS